VRLRTVLGAAHSYRQRMDKTNRISHGTAVENARIAYLLAATESDPVFQAQLTQIAEMWGEVARRLAISGSEVRLAKEVKHLARL
jgi:hypothetical protein